MLFIARSALPLLLIPALVSLGSAQDDSEHGGITSEADRGISLVTVLANKAALNEAHDVEIRGPHAFVAGKGGSVAVVEVSEPRRPRLLFAEPGFGNAETVLPVDGQLFVGAGSFHSVDFRPAAGLTITASIRDRRKFGSINGMARTGDVLVAASKSGLLTAIDASDPSGPRVAGVRDTTRDSLASPHDVDLVGPYAVIAEPGGFGLRPGSLALFRIFDDSGRLLPESRWERTGVTSSDNLTGANRVQVSGDTAYVAGSYAPRHRDGNTRAKGVAVDLGNPVTPREISSLAFSDARGPNGLTVTGDVWFLAGGQTVEAYDIRDPAQPRRLASFRSAESFPTADDNAHDLVYRDGYLYVTSQSDHALVVLAVGEAIRRLATP